MPATDILKVLQDEEAVIRNRHFDRLPELATRKEALLAEISGNLDQDLARRIREQAAINERLLDVSRQAVKSIQTRLLNLSRKDMSVGYAPDGDRLSCSPELSTRRA